MERGAAFAHAAETSQCIVCHQDWEDEDGPSFKFARDIHFQKGLDCSDCHGGDPSLDDMDEVRSSYRMKERIKVGAVSFE